LFLTMRTVSYWHSLMRRRTVFKYWSDSGAQAHVHAYIRFEWDFTFYLTLAYKEREVILGGLSEIQYKTCIEFYIFNHTSALDGYDYVYITKAKRGCWSHIGRVGRGQQVCKLLLLSWYWVYYILVFIVVSIPAVPSSNPGIVFPNFCPIPVPRRSYFRTSIFLNLLEKSMKFSKK
jgi:hypothetical protein